MAPFSDPCEKKRKRFLLLLLLPFAKPTLDPQRTGAITLQPAVFFAPAHFSETWTFKCAALKTHEEL